MFLPFPFSFFPNWCAINVNFHAHDQGIHQGVAAEPTLLTPGGRRVAPQDQAEGDHREGK